MGFAPILDNACIDKSIKTCRDCVSEIIATVLFLLTPLSKKLFSKQSIHLDSKFSLNIFLTFNAQ